MLRLERIKKSDARLQADMANHYSQPKGFVGRQIFYAVYFDGLRYGSIAGGSASRFLAGRDEFFNLNGDRSVQIHRIINNTFFHIEGDYPARNFAQKVVKLWRHQVELDWFASYGETVIGFETLVELPRSGEVYKRDGWQEVGQTIGYTCKRIAGQGTDSWTGKRVWDTKNLRPKRVFCKIAQPLDR